MNIKQAMAASDVELDGMVLKRLGGCTARRISTDLTTAWPLIPRDSNDKNWSVFWLTVHRMIPQPFRGIKFEEQMCAAWIMAHKDPARVAHIICVCWLAAEGRIEA